MLTILAMAAAMSAPPQTGPSFDCRQAETPVQDAICADRRLAALDRRMAARFDAAAGGLDSAGRVALTADQQWFLAARDEWFEYRDSPAFSGFPDLADRMEARIAFLDAIDPTRSGLVGEWSNAAGTVEIVAEPDGRLKVFLSGANAVNARWVCEASFVATPGRLLEGRPEADPEVWIRITPGADHIEVAELGPDGAPTRPGYCGANGRMAGAYFPARSTTR